MFEKTTNHSVRGRCSHRLSGRQRLSDVSPFWIVKLLLLGSLKDVEKSLKDVSTMMFLPLKNSFPTSWSIRWLPYNDIYSCKWYLMDMFISTWMGFNTIYPWKIGIYTLNIVFAYFIYICIYMYIAYIYIQVYLFMCLLYIHTYHTYIHTYVCTYVHACMHAYVCTYVHACMHAYIRTYILTYILSYILTYLHTYIRTYVHTYIRTYVNT